MRSNGYIHWLAGSLEVSYLVISLSWQAQAQITPDNTLPIPTKITNSDNLTETEIVEGTEVGKNLFHSFAEFSVLENTTVRFINNSAGVQNVISRITGDSVSRILGKISSGGDFPIFNLFLLNPNGIIFGSNASLDIKGSFVTTTADAIQFGEQGFFSATDPGVLPLLSIDPSAFLFNRIAAHRGNITVNSGRLVGSDTSGLPIYETGLSIPEGRSLLLIGGNINLDGGVINVPNGRVELGGLTEIGAIELNIDNNTFSLDFPDGVRRADVLVTNQSIVDVADRGNGSILINARNIEVSEISNLLSGIQPGLNLGDSNLGKIELNATEKVIINNSDLGTFVNFNATGNSPNIYVEASSLEIINGGSLYSLSAGTGNSGDIFINVSNELMIRGQGVKEQRGVFDSQINNGLVGLGRGGDIRIKARSLTIADEAAIISSTVGKGNAGNIWVQVDDFVSLDSTTNQISPTQITTSVEAGAEGNGGTINIQARSLSLTDGAALTAFVAPPEPELGFPSGKGNAGNIILNVSDSIYISEVGVGGLLSGIFASIERGAEGQGGNITINTNTLLMSRQGQISTTSDGTGDAGNITIDSLFVTGSGNSDIIANSQGGQGGAINITATGVFGLFVRDKLTPGNDITAFSEQGAELNGVVELNTLEIDPSRGLIRLPELVINPSTLITQNICRQGRGSELSKTGRGGLPPSVNQDLSDGATQIDLVEPVPTENNPTETNKSSNLNSEQIEPAQGWIFNEKGEVVLTAYNPNITEPQRLRDNSANCPTP